MAEHWRPIAGFDGYVVNATGVVWSVGRTIQTKGGATRTTAAKPLKPDEKNRVALRRDGKTYKLRVDQLAAREFPPQRHYSRYRRIVLCCRWCHRDFDGFIIEHCENRETMWPDLFRCPHCTTAGDPSARSLSPHPLLVEDLFTPERFVCGIPAP